MPALWENPFSDFLLKTEEACAKAKPLSALGSEIGRIVKILEERDFVSDIVLRVSSMAAAFDRLRDLYLIYREGDEARTILHRQAQGQPVEIPDSLAISMKRCHREAIMLTSFVYYEASAVVGLLRDCLQVRAGSHLEYLLGVRDKILVHPKLSSRIKQSASAISFGPILHAHLVAGTGSLPSVRTYYQQQFGSVVDEAEGKCANVKVIRSKARMGHLSGQELLMLKAFNVPEPDIVKSAEELAIELGKGFLTRMRKAYAIPT